MFERFKKIAKAIFPEYEDPFQPTEENVLRVITDAMHENLVSDGVLPDQPQSKDRIAALLQMPSLREAYQDAILSRTSLGTRRQEDPDQADVRLKNLLIEKLGPGQKL